VKSFGQSWSVRVDILPTSVHSKPVCSLYDAVTNRIVAALGAKSFTMPWHSPNKPIAVPSNAST
jgi:hypothetical protein